MTPEFDTVLVANRGEIARRVIRTLRTMGVRSVAVYSDADADAPHVREADVAVRIGPAAAAESYLSIPAVIGAAQRTGAQAIHPGYGFLSENVDFAEACSAAGIAFIGPPDEAVRIMGDKIRSKEHVAASGVPVVPGFSAVGLSDDEIAERAQETGFPLLIKPSAGGGGKGMEIARDVAALPAALASARRVARAAFGDDSLLLERLVENPRHIEVQVIADAHGHTVHLGERECTLQRRHQKVIEEAPSAFITAEVRERLGAAAVAAAASVGYVGAGTVEFIAGGSEPDEFFFIEMNTRLQVEHPVTEEVTGIDLVREQVRVAAGLPLSFAQGDIVLHGHAVEARVYAESPSRGFLPEIGRVLAWHAPRGVRVDAAIESGSVIGSDYDPMIAKVISHAPTRALALERLSQALGDTVLLGVDSNLAFLRDLVDDPDVRSGQMDTGLIDRRGTFVYPEVPAIALEAAAQTVGRGDGDLWQSQSGFRLASAPHALTHDFQLPDGTVSAAQARAHREVSIATDGETLWTHAAGVITRLVPLSRSEARALTQTSAASRGGAIDPVLRAPMPGTVVTVHVATGDEVEAGDRILTIEAMKMEHHLVAPSAGTITVDLAVGAQVRRDQPVAHLHTSDTQEKTA